jgi:signal transduction histidine kinase
MVDDVLDEGWTSGNGRGPVAPVDTASNWAVGPWDALNRLPRPTLLAIVAALYLALAQASIWLNDPVQLGAAFWPAAGLSLGLLLVLDRPAWPWVLTGVAIAEVGGDLLHGYPVSGIVFWAAGNVVEPLVGALLIRRFSSERGSLTPLRSLLGFVLWGVLAGPLVGATIGSIGTVVSQSLPPAMVWPKYVVGDALGVLVVAPVLLTWGHRGPARPRVEAGLLAASSAAATFLVFRNWDVVWDVTLPYLIVPFLVWAGLRFGLRGVALIALMIATIANVATSTGYGPFAITGGTEHAVTLLQVFLGISLTTGLVLASLASDLTDSRDLARRLSEHHQAERRNRRFRDTFVGVLSHEIRTPITTIYGMSELLRKRHRRMEPERLGQYLEDIAGDADRLRRLTEDLLVLSRAEGGRLDVATNPLMIGHLVRTTVESERVRSSDHHFVVKGPTQLPLVLGEEVYVEQIARNFLGNAAKYSPPGTNITVTLVPEADGVAVRVTDSGPGLPEGPPERLFDVFYRAPDAIGSTSGAGIGLFVCRELAQAMGGRVWAGRAAGGTGAEFGFWLPEATDAVLADQ